MKRPIRHRGTSTIVVMVPAMAVPAGSTRAQCQSFSCEDCCLNYDDTCPACSFPNCPAIPDPPVPQYPAPPCPNDRMFVTDVGTPK